MSYDLYCYKSKLGKPDLEEAYAVIEVDDEKTSTHGDPAIKFAIAKAITNFNPRFENFEFDYAEIARLKGISEDEAKAQFSHIELTTIQGDVATQLTIFDNSVSITVPYWYAGDKAKEVFDKVSEYTKIIRRVAGYFVFDPQTENVYDPLTGNFDGLDVYTSTSGKVEEMRNKQETTTEKKPWWKFW
jgi:hypothetical protein